jgi:hypothetical protein
VSFEKIHRKLSNLANPKKAKILKGFFKPGPGQYGEGDVFLGISVPISRKLAKEYEDLHDKEVLELLRSAIHEERLLSLLILIRKYPRGKGEEKNTKMPRSMLRYTIERFPEAKRKRYLNGEI